MTVKCAACGKAITIEGQLEDGQQLECPFCGEIVACSKPTRIAVPPRPPRKEQKPERIPLPPRPPRQEAKPVTPPPPPPPRPSKTKKRPALPPEDIEDIPDIPVELPKLAIRRPPAPQNYERDNRNALVDRVRQRAKAESRRAFWAGVKKHCNNIFWFLVLIGLCWGGWWFYRHWQDDSLESEVSGMVDEGKKLVQENSAKPTDVEPEAKEVKDREAEVKPAVEVRPAAPGDEFKRITQRFKNARVMSWKDLDKASRPGVADARFTLWTPVAKTAGRFYEITSSPTGIVSIVEYREDGVAQRTPNDSYEKMMTERGGLICDDQAAYFVAVKQPNKVILAPTRPGESFDPGAEYFGTAKEIISRYRMDTSDVKLEVTFWFPDTESVVVGTAQYGEKLSYARFKTAIDPLVKQVRGTTLGKKPGYKPFKRTVVFYDGNVVAKGMNLTKVPRRGNHLIGDAYRQWSSLSQEAYRQESKAQESEYAQKRAIDEWQRAMDAPPSDAEANRVLGAGNVRMKRK